MPKVCVMQVSTWTNRCKKGRSQLRRRAEIPLGSGFSAGNQNVRALGAGSPKMTEMTLKTWRRVSEDDANRFRMRGDSGAGFSGLYAGTSLATSGPVGARLTKKAAASAVRGTGTVTPAPETTPRVTSIATPFL